MKVLTWFGIQKVLVFLLLVFLVLCIDAQELSRDELDVHAKELFDAGQYSDAVDAFEKLINIYPKEASYNYFLGRCYLSTNSNLEKSITLLRFSASRNYNPDVHFYLAKAFYLSYKFDEAEVSLLNFKNLANKRTQQLLDAEALQASIIRAREEIYMVQDVKVLSSEALKTNQLEGVYALHIHGKFAKMPTDFMAAADINNAYQGVMYFPGEAPNGYKYFISSYGKNGKTEKDIYEISQITALDYSLPQYLSEINSASNEEYPYFDIMDQTLYFSSDRKGGLGGYDIYYSKYNTETSCFGIPKRFEFPINSAADDFLYVPDTNRATVIFLSNRLDYGDNLTAFKIKMTDTANYIFPKSVVEFQQLSQLHINKEKESPLIIENLSPAIKPKVFSEYDLTLQEALEKQLVCDSLQAELLSKKNLLRVATDMNEGRVLIASITAIEAQIDLKQAKADSLFVKARELSTTKLKVVELSEPNKNIALEKEVNGLKVYSFLPSEQYAEISEVNITEEELEYKGETSESLISQFAILAASPYNETIPIPENEEVPGGLIYRIQLGAFGKKLPMNAFGGLSPVSAEVIKERNLTKYFVGYFSSSEDAHAALISVKTYGFGDAFIVPYFEKKKITINAARELEFGQKLNID